MASGNPTVTTKLLSEDVSLSSGLDRAETQLDDLARSFGDTYDDLEADFRRADEAIAALDHQIAVTNRRIEMFQKTMMTVGAAAGAFMAVKRVLQDIDSLAQKQEEGLGRYRGLIGEYLDGWIKTKQEVREVNRFLVDQAGKLADMIGRFTGIFDFSQAVGTEPRAQSQELTEMLERRSKLYEKMRTQMNLVVAEERKSRDILEDLVKWNQSLIRNRERMIEDGVKAQDIDMTIRRTQQQISRITAERWAKEIEKREKALELERKLAQAESDRHQKALAAAGREGMKLQENVERAEQRIDDLAFTRRQFEERDPGFKSQTFNDPAALQARLQGGLFNRESNARQQQIERMDRRMKQAQDQHKEALREQEKWHRELIREIGIPQTAGFL